MADAARGNRHNGNATLLPAMPPRFRDAIGRPLLRRIAAVGPNRLRPGEVRRLDRKLTAFTHTLEREAAEIEQQTEQLEATLARLARALHTARGRSA